MLARIGGALVVQRFVEDARVGLALQARGILLAEVVAHALARVAAAVDHDQHQPDEPGHRARRAPIAPSSAEPLLVVVHVDLIGFAPDLFQLFGRLVHGVVRPML